MSALIPKEKYLVLINKNYIWLAKKQRSLIQDYLVKPSTADIELPEWTACAKDDVLYFTRLGDRFLCPKIAKAFETLADFCSYIRYVFGLKLEQGTL